MGEKRSIPTAWLREIERRLLRAETPSSFVPRLAEKWMRSERRVWGYVTRARQRLAERARSQDPDADREQIRAMVLETYRGARKHGDRKAQVAATRLLADVAGVLAPKRVDVTSNGQTVGVDPGDPRWADLQRECFGTTRQGVDDATAARPDGEDPPVAPR